MRLLSTITLLALSTTAIAKPRNGESVADYELVPELAELTENRAAQIYVDTNTFTDTALRLRDALPELDVRDGRRMRRVPAYSGCLVHIRREGTTWTVRYNGHCPLPALEPVPPAAAPVATEPAIEAPRKPTPESTTAEASPRTAAPDVLADASATDAADASAETDAPAVAEAGAQTDVAEASTDTDAPAAADASADTDATAAPAETDAPAVADASADTDVTAATAETDAPAVAEGGAEQSPERTEAPAPVSPLYGPRPTDTEPKPLSTRTLSGPKLDAGMLAFGAAYGSYAGLSTGFLIGEALEDNEDGHTTQGLAPGLLGGAVVGTSVGYLLATRRDYRDEEVALLFSGSGIGGFFGAEIGRALIPEGADGAHERIHAATLAGSMAGVGMASVFAPKAASIGDQARFALATAVGWQTGAGLAALLPREQLVSTTSVPVYKSHRQRNAGIELAGAASFAALGAAANHAGLESPTPTTLALSIGHGAWVGAWAPLLVDDTPDERAIAGGLRLGTGLGYASALGMSALGQPSPRSAALQTAGFAAGSALGAGIPMSLSKDGHPRGVVGPMLLSGVAGQAFGAAIAPTYREFDANDAALLGVMQAWTGYQALGWGLWANTARDEISGHPLGYGLSAAGAGTLTTLVLSPHLDVTPAGSMMLLSAGGWGSWAGAWGSQIAGADANGVWLSTLASGNGTLLAAGVAQGLGWKPGWRHLGVVNGMGLMGAAAGGLLGVVALYEEDNWSPLMASTLIGSGVGLGAGMILAHTSKKESVAMLPEVPGLKKVGLKAQVSARPWMDDNGQAGAWVQVDLTEIVD